MKRQRHNTLYDPNNKRKKRVYEDILQVETVRELQAVLCEEDGHITQKSIERRLECVKKCRGQHRISSCEISAQKSILAMMRLLTVSIKECSVFFPDINYSDVELHRVMIHWIDAVLSHHMGCCMKIENVLNPSALFNHVLTNEEFQCVASEGHVFTVFLRALCYYSNYLQRASLSMELVHTVMDLNELSIGRVCTLLCDCITDANDHDTTPLAHTINFISDVLCMLESLSFFDKMHRSVLRGMYEYDVQRFLNTCTDTIYKNEQLADVISVRGFEVTTELHLRTYKMLYLIDESFCDITLNCM